MAIEGRPARSVRRMLAAVVLSFEALVILFAGLVARAESSGGSGTLALLLAAVLALACLLTAGMLRGPAGYRIGWLLQVLVLAAGFGVTAMFFLGAVFVLLWAAGLRIGGRIDQERVEAESDPGSAA